MLSSSQYEVKNNVSLHVFERCAQKNPVLIFNMIIIY